MAMMDKEWEKSCEQLSALVDGEVSELELHRILKQASEEPELASKWSRYQVASAVLKGETHGNAQQWQSFDISSRVAAAISQEPDIQVKARPGWFKPLANVAVAASVSAAVVVGWQSMNSVTSSGFSNGPAVTAASSPPAQPVPARQLAAGNSPLMTVAQGNGVTNSSIQAQPHAEIIRYNPELDDRLNEYLISHSGNAAFNTPAGVASYARAVNIKPGEVVVEQVKVEK